MIHIKNLTGRFVHDQMTRERLIRWSELLITVLLAVAIARLVADLMSPVSIAPDASITVQQAPAVQDPARLAGNVVDGYQVSAGLMRLFGETATPMTPQIAEQPLQQTSLNLVLKGILADQATDNRFALIAVRGQKEKVFRTGEKVEGADILRIEARRVVIRRNGVTEALDLEVRKLSGETASGSMINRNDFTGAIRKISDTERVIPRSTLRQQLNNLPSLLQQASAVPHIDNGQQTGFRIVNIRQGSVFEDLGIQQDDIIYAVNGIPVRNAGDAMNAYRNLATSSSFVVAVRRGGQDLNLNLSVQ